MLKAVGEEDERANNSLNEEGRQMQKWEYMVVPLAQAGTLRKKSVALSPDRLNELGAEGWEAVGLSLKRGDLVAWPVVLLKRPLD